MLSRSWRLLTGTWLTSNKLVNLLCFSQEDPPLSTLHPRWQCNACLERGPPGTRKSIVSVLSVAKLPLMSATHFMCLPCLKRTKMWVIQLFLKGDDFSNFFQDTDFPGMVLKCICPRLKASPVNILSSKQQTDGSSVFYLLIAIRIMTNMELSQHFEMLSTWNTDPSWSAAVET